MQQQNKTKWFGHKRLHWLNGDMAAWQLTNMWAKWWTSWRFPFGPPSPSNKCRCCALWTFRPLNGHSELVLSSCTKICMEVIKSSKWLMKKNGFVCLQVGIPNQDSFPSKWIVTSLSARWLLSGQSNLLCKWMHRWNGSNNSRVYLTTGRNAFLTKKQNKAFQLIS